MKTMKDYHDVYLKRDVLLLGHVFGKFRNNSLKYYGLCPSHYLSAPDLSWDAMINMTKVKLDFVAEMYLLFEKRKSGGVSDIPERYSEACNEYLKSNDPKQ